MSFHYEIASSGPGLRPVKCPGVGMGWAEAERDGPEARVAYLARKNRDAANRATGTRYRESTAAREARVSATLERTCRLLGKLKR